jgi:hypothetical protein
VTFQEDQCRIPKGDRLRRGQGDQRTTHRANNLHAIRRDDRHAAVHEPRTGRQDGRRRRYPQRCLFTGVVLYELFTGSTPFDRETLKQANPIERLRIIRENLRLNGRADRAFRPTSWATHDFAKRYEFRWRVGSPRLRSFVFVFAIQRVSRTKSDRSGYVRQPIRLQRWRTDFSRASF